MYKLICSKNDCDNKDIVYYLPEPSDQIMCGGCKTFNSAVEMSQAEFDEVFDYDPFAKPSIGLE